MYIDEKDIEQTLILKNIYKLYIKNWWIKRKIYHEINFNVE